MAQINALQAREKIAAWDAIRRTIPDAKAVLASNHYFAFDSGFDWEDFLVLDIRTHAYLGYEEATAPFEPKNLKLIVITKHADKRFAQGLEGEPYIYEAPYMPVSGPLPPAVFNNAKVQRWATDIDPWLSHVNLLPPDPNGGTTRAFDIPLFDLLDQVVTVNDAHKELHVFFGMRNAEEQPEWSARPDLLTYHPATDALLHFMSVDNFTSPKPPFGSVELADYGLLT